MLAGAMMRWAGVAAAALIAGCAAPQTAPPGPDGAAVAMAAGVVPPAAGSSAETPMETNVPVESLLDVHGTMLRARFGEPHQTRRDGGAEVWNYEAAALCRLNLVMQSVRGAPLKVVHAQARMAADGTEATCLQQLERGGTGVMPVAAPVAAPRAAPAVTRPAVPVRRAAPARPRRGR